MRRLLPIYARELIRRAADALNVTEEQLLSPNRCDKLSHGRFAVMLALRSNGWSYPRIAAATRRQDHTTVIHGIRRARRMRCTNPAFNELLEAITGPSTFIPGVTDQGPSRPAKGGFPYPGHGTLADQAA